MRRVVTGWLGALALGLGLCIAGQGLAQDTPAQDKTAQDKTAQDKTGQGAVVRDKVVQPTVDASGTMVVTPSQPVQDTLADAAGPLDYDAWSKMAVAAEALIGNPAATASEIDQLRSQLVDWRSAFLGAQNANASRIATLRTQIAALGAAPAEGVSEPEDIAKRRVELGDQLVRLQAPGLAADEAYQRADGLIREIDALLRNRQADQLLQLWPMPINPANWPEAFRTASRITVVVYNEFRLKWASPTARATLGDVMPMVLGLLALAGLILWRGRLWIDRLIYRLQSSASARGRRIVAFLASLGQILIPVLGVVLVTVALTMTGMLGGLSLVLVAALPVVGTQFFIARWLGGRVFPTGEHAESPLGLVDERRVEGRVLSTSFGILLALETLRQVVLDQQQASQTATSVIAFPLIVVGGLMLFRMGHFLQQHLSAADTEETPASYGDKLMLILARAAMAVGVVAPLLAAVGYVPAASALVYPSVMSLALMALLLVLQQLIGEIYAVILRHDEAAKDALAPVLIGFVLALMTIPVFALIWGARVADLTELWNRFSEGVQLGQTRISPTVFLIFAIVFGVGYALTRVFQGALRSSILPRTALDQGGQTAVISGVGYLGIFLAALIAINAAGIDLSGLAIVAGALSVGIGFGLQTVVGNFVSGIILLIERPISEGDWIEVGTTQGIVKSISVRSTRIQTFDRSNVIVPNQDLISGTVTNFTRFSLSGRLIVPVGVAYGSDTRKVEAVLREIAEAQPMVVLTPPPAIILAGFGADSINFEMRMILRDVNFGLTVRSEINHAIVEAFAAQGIEIPFTQQDIHLRNVGELADALRAVPQGRAKPAVARAPAPEKGLPET
jgi:potassium-dependent mechanosensitive channel